MDYQASIARVIGGASSKPSTVVTISIELGSSSVSLVAVGKETSPGGESENLLGTKSIAFSRLSETAVVIEAFIAESARKASGPSAHIVQAEAVRLIVSFPRQQAILRFLELPSTDDRELKSMAKLQALNGLPFQEEELVSDISILSRDVGEGRSSVLLTIVRKSTLAPYLELFDHLGRWPQGFVLTTFGVNEFIKRTKSAAPTNYLHLGLMDGWLNIDIYMGSRLLSSRSVPSAQKDPSGARILREVQQSLDSLETTDGIQLPEKIFVTRQSQGLQEHMDAPLAEEFHVPVVSLSDTRGGQSSESVSAIGAAYVGAACSIMLLPSDVLEKRSRHEARRGMVSAAGWFGVWLGIAAGIGGLKLLRAEWQLSSLDSQLKQVAPEAQKAADALERAALLHVQADDGAAPLDILRELTRSAPQGVTVRTVTRSPDGSIQIQGSAPRLVVVMEFVNGLQHSRLFARAELHGSSLKSIQNVDSVDFQIQGVIRGASKSAVRASRRRRA